VLSFRYFINDAHRALYGIKAKFRDNEDWVVTTSEKDYEEVCHVHARLIAVKEN
jgi:hypothetical protein